MCTSLIIALGILPSCYWLLFNYEHRAMPFFPIEYLDLSKKPSFVMAYFSQVIEGTFGPAAIIGVDFSIMAIIAQTSAQLRLLQYSMR